MIYNLPQEKYDVLVGASAGKCCHLESMTSPVVQPPSTIPDLGSSPVNITNTFFFETVSEQCWQDCIADFINATGTDAMASSICTICAGSFFHSEMDFVSLASLHKSGLLVPLTSHPAHILTDGMLLHHNPSCFSLDIAGHSQATVCWPCLSSLNRKKTPALSLANSLWVGDIPIVLHILTLPEHVLVARFFLRCTSSNYILRRRALVPGPLLAYTVEFVGMFPLIV